MLGSLTSTRSTRGFCVHEGSRGKDPFLLSVSDPAAMSSAQSIEPFSIDVPSSAITDLRRRLRDVRWPAGITDSSGGFALASTSRLADHWRDAFDWYAQQERLNALPQFVTTIAGSRVHFVHLRSLTRSNALPVLLLHGWPGSFVELLSVGAQLSAERDVVIPSIPGFGFSSSPIAAGTSNRTVADTMASLMSSAGYDRFVVHGGDIGAGVAMWLAVLSPDRVAGLHLNFIPGSYAPPVADDVTAEERAFLEQRDRFSDTAGAYAHMQRTRPLTLAYGLTDSPVGLLAWIAEKFFEWTDPASSIADDTLLTNVSIYWFTNTIASSVRFYFESSRTPLRFEAGAHVIPPLAVARFPFELPMPPRSWVERVFHVTRWTDMPHGGHFAALEQPARLAVDIGTFVSSVS